MEKRRQPPFQHKIMSTKVEILKVYFEGANARTRNDRTKIY